MRFNNIERLRLWRNRGQFPAIHDNIFNAIVTYMSGEAVLDLCCGFGLLGQRVIESGHALRAVGVDEDEQAIEEAKESQIDVVLYPLKITGDTIADVAKIVKSCKLDTMFARRALPELFGGETAGSDLSTGQEFIAALHSAGIREVFVEGRVQVQNAKNALPSISAEVSLLNTHYREVKRLGAVSYLRAI